MGLIPIEIKEIPGKNNIAWVRVPDLVQFLAIEIAISFYPERKFIYTFPFWMQKFIQKIHFFWMN